MNSVRFYDDDWQRLLRQHPLIARKIEDLRCQAVCYQEFEELRKRVDQLEKQMSPEVTTKETYTRMHMGCTCLRCQLYRSSKFWPENKTSQAEGKPRNDSTGDSGSLKDEGEKHA